MLSIEFARGDSYSRGFIVKRDGEPVTEPFDDIYFTVKKNYMDTEYLLQKRLSTGGIVNDGGGHYTLNIPAGDTDQFGFGDYDCDIEVTGESGAYKRTFYGKMRLTKEVTYHANES